MQLLSFIIIRKLRITTYMKNVLDNSLKQGLKKRCFISFELFLL